MPGKHIDRERERKKERERERERGREREREGTRKLDLLFLACNFIYLRPLFPWLSKKKKNNNNNN